MSIETMTKLATTTLSTSTASVTFSNIPQGYTDLKISVSGRTTGTSGRDYIVFNFNSSTGVYDRIWAAGFDGTQTTSARTTSETYGFFGTVPDANATASTFGNAQFYITNYTSNNLKSYTIDAVAENNSTGTYMLTLVAGSWDNTSALTSITFYAVGSGSLSSPTGSFLTNSTFTLYGVKAKRTVTNQTKKVYVTGGTLYSDSSFYYRKFTSSGTLDISGNTLFADILVIAGGGAGGSSASSGYYGGGGGAGGLLSFTNTQLSGTIPVVIGAGGAYPGANLRGLSGSDSSLGNLVLGRTLALGGGGGGGGSDSSALITANKNGGVGGSGGGGQSAVGTGGLGGGTGGLGTTGQGNNGGNGAGAFQIEPQAGGGGGGAGGAGTNAASAAVGGAGGVGSSAFSSWGLATSSGQLSSGVYYFAGGGGGASNGTGGAAGLGGGGVGGGSNGANGTANTGGGAGNGMVGGSGIVIVRYTKSQVL